MKKCCECKKIVWPWQQSNISFSHIHIPCHQKLLSAAAKDSKMREMLAEEIISFKSQTGIQPNVNITSRLTLAPKRRRRSAKSLAFTEGK